MRVLPQERRSRSFAIALMVVGVAASIFAGLSVRSQNAAEAEHWLSDRGEVVRASTKKTVEQAIVGLSALAALFENSVLVTQEEFDGFVESLDPSMRLVGIGYVAVIAADELDAHIAGTRATVPDYSVTSFDADGEPQPVARDRKTYYPVEVFKAGSLVMEAITNSAADVTALGIGYDVGSPDEWRPSFELSVAGDTPAVSAFVDVGAGETVLGKAFVVSVPVHDDAGAVVGLVVAPMVDFLLTTEVDFAITESVSWSITAGGAARDADGPFWKRTLEFPGVAWDLVVVPAEGALSEMSQVSPWMVVLGGLALTGLVAYLFLLAHQRSRARGEMEEMERRAQDKDRFLASISHEIRTPLTVVSGLAHELRDRPNSFRAEEATELLTMIARQSEEVAAIVEDLLVATRADLGMVTIIRGTIDLEREATEVLESTGVEAAIVGDTIFAWADASRVRQILRNLVSNARRYGGPDKEIRFGSEDGCVWVEVVDSGLPIPIEARSRIFDAYVSSSATADSGFGAMGLGLYISHKLAELLGGRLTYRHDGSFSIFRLTLPATEEAAAEPAA